MTSITLTERLPHARVGVRDVRGMPAALIVVIFALYWEARTVVHAAR
jgi:hypothetical protein